MSMKKWEDQRCLSNVLKGQLASLAKEKYTKDSHQNKLTWLELGYPMQKVSKPDNSSTLFANFLIDSFLRQSPCKNTILGVEVFSTRPSRVPASQVSIIHL